MDWILIELTSLVLGEFCIFHTRLSYDLPIVVIIQKKNTKTQTFKAREITEFQREKNIKRRRKNSKYFSLYLNYFN